MRRLRPELAIGLAVLAMVGAACGTTGQNASNRSPVAATPSLAVTAAVSPPAAQSPSPSPADIRLVISDFTATQVRLARPDATDTAIVKGYYVGTAGGQAIVLNGTTLQALNRNGTVAKLGQLAVNPELVGFGTVAVDPQLDQWLYATRDDASNATIHLGTPTSDRVIATLPSPDGNAYYQPYVWNASGAYMVRSPVGIGGAGPFLDYRFPLAKFDVTSGHVTDVSPQCIVYQVLDDGTMICGRTNVGGQIEVRTPSGHGNLIQLAVGGGGTGDAYVSVSVSPDGKRLIAGRNGSKDPVINYQMAIATVTSSSAQAFGPLDFVPDTFLPDGRVVAEHRCAYSGWGGGPCDASLDGTYFFSADGTSHTLFFKLVGGASVVGYL